MSLRSAKVYMAPGRRTTRPTAADRDYPGHGPRFAAGRDSGQTLGRETTGYEGKKRARAGLAATALAPVPATATSGPSTPGTSRRATASTASCVCWSGVRTTWRGSAQGSESPRLRGASIQEFLGPAARPALDRRGAIRYCHQRRRKVLFPTDSDADSSSPTIISAHFRACTQN